MSKHWYFQAMGEVIGPVTSVQLKDRVEHGQIQADTLIRLGDDGKWRMAASVKGLFAGPPPSEPAAAPEEPSPGITQVTATPEPQSAESHRGSSGAITAPERTYHIEGEEVHSFDNDDDGEYDFFKFVGFELALGPLLHQAFVRYCHERQLSLTQGTRQAIATRIGREDLLEGTTPEQSDPATGSLVVPHPKTKL